jgi:hypothetical protein
MTTYDEAAGAARKDFGRANDTSAKASELVDQILKVSKNLGSVVGREARSAVNRVTDQLSEKTEAGVDRGANTLGSLAKAMQTAGNEVASESPGLARSLNQAAGHVESFADTIKGQNLSDLTHGAAELARRNPTLFLAGTIAAGFALSRFLRSSSGPDGAIVGREES